MTRAQPPLPVDQTLREVLVHVMWVRQMAFQKWSRDYREVWFSFLGREAESTGLSKFVK